MIVKVLIENSRICDGFLCEHGLSLYVETEKHKILYDFGQSDLLFENAEKLGVDVSKVDIAFLSHAHYDHSGGLKTFLKRNLIAKVYLSSAVFKDYYNGNRKYIGVDKSLSGSERLVLLDDAVKIDDELTFYSADYVSGKIPEQGLTEKIENRFVKDEFLHERYLVITENGKKVLLSGCSHRNVVNVLNAFPCDVFLGGLHFSKIDVKDTDFFDFVAKVIDKNCKIVYCGHCTGDAQWKILHSLLGDKCKKLSSGKIIKI